MILLSLGVFAFAVADLIRWSPGRVSKRRGALAIAGSVALTGALAALSGMDFAATLAVGVGAAVASGVWVGFDYSPLEGISRLSLAWILVVLLALFAVAGSADSIEGEVGEWYANLPFGFAENVPVDQFVLGVAGGLFLMATTNRIVRLVLDATSVSWQRGESVLKGGRVLGPLERLVIGAIVLAGDPAAAAIVITAKGLLRFPEIRGDSRGSGPDAVTEYFLLGTFASLFVAATVALLVLAAS